ncbi:hypothetical protein Tco_1461732, partial [Tanacetum coccineum]
RKEKSLDYNNSFLGEYECSSLALDKVERRGEKEEIGSLETRSNNVSDQEIYIYRLENPTVTAGGHGEADAVTLLKRIRKFSMTQDIGARAAVHIFNRISFAIAKRVRAQIPCLACSRVFAGDIYGDLSCAVMIGIKHRHNIVRDTLVDICYRSGISAGKEVDIGLDGGLDKPLRLADMLLYLWDGGLDVCVDLTGSSPLTQIGMVDFVSGRAVIDAAQRKRGKYMAKCAAIGYVFLPFSFSSLGELETDTVTLLKLI